MVHLIKVGRVFPMVISTEFHIGQCRDNASHFSSCWFITRLSLPDSKIPFAWYHTPEFEYHHHYIWRHILLVFAPNNHSSPILGGGAKIFSHSKPPFQLQMPFSFVNFHNSFLHGSYFLCSFIFDSFYYWRGRMVAPNRTPPSPSNRPPRHFCEIDLEFSLLLQCNF